MLTEHSPNIMMRTALAVLAECEEDLLKLHDFEDLITYLKVRRKHICIGRYHIVIFAHVTPNIAALGRSSAKDTAPPDVHYDSVSTSPAIASMKSLQML